MTEITPISTGTAVTTEAPSRRKSAPVSPPAEVSAEPQVTLEQLLERNRQLEAERDAAKEQADGYRDQYEKLKNRPRGEVEMTTTTTKPVLRFSVSNGSVADVFSVVDESEAKRLYCVKHKLEPSSVNLTVECLDKEKRDAGIVRQHQEAADRNRQLLQTGVDTTRIPGVTVG